MFPLHPAQSVGNLKVETGGLPEVSTVTAVADVGGSLNNKYFTFRNAADAAFYCWLNINSAGVDPAPGGTGIEATAATNATAAAIATAIQAAIDAHASFLAVRDGATVQITNAANGVATDIGAGDSGFTVANRFQGQASTYEPSTAPSSISLTPSTF